MMNLGMVRPGETVYIPFGSYAASTGAPSAMTNLVAGDIKVYKDGSITERASTSGYTLLDTDGLDFDGLTGINGVSISLADNTTAGFWAAGSRYFVVVSDVTVDGQTLRFVAATFEIGLPGAALNTTIASLASQTSFTLTNGPAEDDALNGCVVYIHDVASAVQGGFAVISDYTGSTKTVTLAAGTTFTATAADNVSVMPPPADSAGVTTLLSRLTSTRAGYLDNINNAALQTITAGGIADSVWDEALAGHLTGGTTGAALDAAGSAGDPWSTALPGAYSAGSAGHILGNRLDAAVSSRAVAGDAMTLTSGAIDLIHDEVVDGSVTLRQSIRLLNAAAGGKASGLDTSTAHYRDLADTKDRILATTTADGNRTAITLDLT